MKLLSLSEMEKSVEAKSKSFASLESVENILTALMLTKNGIAMTPKLAKKVKKNTDIEIPVVEGLVNKEDEKDKTYDLELLKLTAFLIAKQRQDKNVKIVEEKYEDFKSFFDKIYESYDAEASETLNLVLDKVEKIKKLDKLDVE